MARSYKTSGLVSGLAGLSDETLDPSLVTEYDFSPENFEYKIDVDINRAPSDMNQLTMADWIPIYQRPKGTNEAFTPVIDKWNGRHVHLYANAAVAFKRGQLPNANAVSASNYDNIYFGNNDLATVLNLPVLYYKPKGSHHWMLARNPVTGVLMKPNSGSYPLLDQVLGSDTFELIKHDDLIVSGIQYSHWIHQRWVDQTSLPSNSAYTKADVMNAYQNEGVENPFGNGKVVTPPPPIVNNPNGIIVRDRTLITPTLPVLPKIVNTDVAQPSPATIAPTLPVVPLRSPPVPVLLQEPVTAPTPTPIPTPVPMPQVAFNPTTFGYNPNRPTTELPPIQLTQDQGTPTSQSSSVPTSEKNGSIGANNNLLLIGLAVLGGLFFLRQ